MLDEGIDLKNVRQVHVMEPWYNLNRIEQIIGRARRNCSHSELPIEERNFMLFLYASALKDKRIESLDSLLYRMAEKKSVKIGQVSRILKSVAVDCLLNKEQQQFAKMTEQIKILFNLDFPFLRENKYSEELKSALEARGIKLNETVEILQKFNGNDVHLIKFYEKYGGRVSHKSRITFEFVNDRIRWEDMLGDCIFFIG